MINILIKLIKKEPKVVIDSHLSHLVPAKYVEKCIITKTTLKKLKNRLKKRNYSKEKIEENLEAEIMQVILEEAKKLKHKIKVIET